MPKLDPNFSIFLYKLSFRTHQRLLKTLVQ